MVVGVLGVASLANVLLGVVGVCIDPLFEFQFGRKLIQVGCLSGLVLDC